MLLDIATTAMPEFALHLHPWSGHEVFSLDPGQCFRLRIFVTQIIRLPDCRQVETLSVTRGLALLVGQVPTPPSASSWSPTR